MSDTDSTSEYKRMMDTEYDNLIYEHRTRDDVPSEWQINQERFAGEEIPPWDHDWDSEDDDELCNIKPLASAEALPQRVCSAQNDVGGRCMNPVSPTTSKCAAGHAPLIGHSRHSTTDSSEPF